MMQDFFIIFNEEDDDDREIALHIGERLQSRGLQEYVAHPGKTDLATVSEGITQSSKVVLLLSSNAITCGWWKMKVHMALMNNFDTEKLIPIWLPDFEEALNPVELQTLHYICYEDNDIFWSKLIASCSFQ